MISGDARSTLLPSLSFIDSDAGYLDHIRPLRNPRRQQASDLFGRTDAGVDPRDAKPRRYAFGFERALHLGLEPAKDRLRRPRGSKQRVARRHVIVAKPALPDRRHVR